MDSVGGQESGSHVADLRNDGHPQQSSSSCASTSLAERPLESALVQVSSSSPEEVEEIKSQLSKLTVKHLKEIGRRFHAVLGKRKCDMVQNLLDLGLSGKLSADLIAKDDPAKPLLALENSQPNLLLSVEEWLLRGEENGESVSAGLRAALGQLTADRLHVVARTVKAKLTGATTKADVIERLIVLSQVGCLGKHAEQEDDGIALSYLDDNVRQELLNLPKFEEIELWIKSLESMKQFHFVNLYVNLVESRDKTFDKESLRAFKSLKGYKFFADGFVRNMWLYPHPGSELVILRAYCHHSLTCNPPLQVFICLNGSTGDVYSARCNCVSGTGAACSHIAACLFALEHAVSSGWKELPTEISPTSQPMKWNQPPKKVVSAKPVKEISFRKSSFAKTSATLAVKCPRSSFDPRAPNDRSLDQARVDQLLEDVKSVFPESGLFHFWEDNPKTVKRRKFEDDGATDNLEQMVQKLILKSRSIPLADESNFNREQKYALFVAGGDLLQRVEELTRQQTASQLWHDLHKGRLTSSRFGEVLHRRKSTCPDNLVTRI